MDEPRKSRESVVISSTSFDLLKHREQVRDGCTKRGLYPIWMEDLTAIGTSNAVKVSLEMVHDADYYVGIIAARYGWIPSEGDVGAVIDDGKFNGWRPEPGISITQIEYEYARYLGIPCLCFIAEEAKETDIHRHFDDFIQFAYRGENREKLNELKTKLEIDENDTTSEKQLLHLVTEYILNSDKVEILERSIYLNRSIPNEEIKQHIREFVENIDIEAIKTRFESFKENLPEPEEWSKTLSKIHYSYVDTGEKGKALDDFKARIRSELLIKNGYDYGNSDQLFGEVIEALYQEQAKKHDPDPLLDLPTISPHVVDQVKSGSPSVGLQSYDLEKARNFYGRGAEIRKLYKACAEHWCSPIILVSGQSGVGLSSLLEAGLLPRLRSATYEERPHLKSKNEVEYRSYNSEISLADTLKDVLDSGANLKTQWANKDLAEAESDQKFFAILDHVDRYGDEELNEFVDSIKLLFDGGNFPKGRLVLAFREEWSAHITQQLDRAHLKYHLFNIKKLDKVAIRRVVRGVGIERGNIPDDVDGTIANYLLADKASPLGASLSLLMTKMWEYSIPTSSQSKVFNNDLFLEAKASSYLEKLIEDILDTLNHPKPEDIESGLALDVLYRFTQTPDLTRGDILDIYPKEKRNDIDGLLDAFVHEKLLREYIYSAEKNDWSIRLLHDNLANPIINLCNESTKKAQKAERILSTYINLNDVDHPENEEGNDQPAEEESESIEKHLWWSSYSTVKEGKPWMRKWSAREEQLFKASWRRRIGVFVLMGVVAIGVLIAWLFNRELKEQVSTARQLNKTFGMAISANAPATGKKEGAGRKVVLKAMFEEYKDDPNPMLKKSLQEALRTSYNDMLYRDPTIQARDPQRVSTERNRVYAMAHHIDKGTHIMAAALDNGEIWLWRTPRLNPADRGVQYISNEPFKITEGHKGSVRALAFANNGDLLISGSDRLLLNREPEEYDTSPTLILWQINSEDGALSVDRIADFGNGRGVWAIAVHPNGTQIATSGEQPTIDIWDLNTDAEKPSVTIKRGLEVRNLGKDSEKEVHTKSLAFESSGIYLLSGNTDPYLRVWKWKSGVNIPTLISAAPDDSIRINSIAVYQDTRTDTMRVAAAGSNAKIYTFTRSGMTLNPDATLQTAGNVYSLDYSADGNKLFSGGADDDITIWPLKDNKQDTTANATLLADHKDTVHSVFYRDDENLILSGSADGSIRIWREDYSKLSEELCSLLGIMDHNQWDKGTAEKLWQDLTENVFGYNDELETCLRKRES